MPYSRFCTIFEVLVAGAACALLLPAAAGCGDGPGRREKPVLAQPDKALDTRDYFPLDKGSRWVFERSQSLDGQPEPLETQTFLAGTGKLPDGTPVFLLDDPSRGALNAVTLCYVWAPEGLLSHEGILGASKTGFSPPFVELPPYVAAGSRWTWSGSGRGGFLEIASEFEGIEKVTVPAGTFEALRIRRELPGGGVITHWYAAKVGPVRMEADLPARGGFPASRQSLRLVSYVKG